MPDRSRNKRPTDPNQLAYRIVQEATEEAPDEGPPPEQPQPEEPVKDPAAVALGRRGGLKGGKARAESMTAEQRKDVARKAAEARWGKKPAE